MIPRLIAASQEKRGDGELRSDGGLQQELNIKDKEIAELRKQLNARGSERTLFEPVVATYVKPA